MAPKAKMSERVGFFTLNLFRAHILHGADERAGNGDGRSEIGHGGGHGRHRRDMRRT
jgi:hypothetical protein